MSEVDPLPEVIARELREAIFLGRYRPGDRLPSERELALRYGANRGSAREALKQLEQLRLIEVQQGGARVAPLGNASLEIVEHMLQMEQPDPVLIVQCLEVFEILLAGAVRLAAERGTQEELTRAHDLLQRAAAPATSDAEYVELLGRLTVQVSDASHNLVLRLVRNGIKSIFTQRFGVGRLRPPRSALAAISATIVEAFAQRDGAAAEEGVRRLLRLSRDQVVKALVQETSVPEEPPARASSRRVRKSAR